MNDLPEFPNGTDFRLEQVVAREHYFRLRENLVVLRAATVPNVAAIDQAIKALEQAQLNYKGTHGVIGNNPIED